MRTVDAMPVLREKVSWKRESVRRKTPELMPDEQKHVRAALVFLHRRLGSWEALAKATGMRPHTLKYSAHSTKNPPTAATAIRIGRAAHVPIDDVLDGKWPPKGACPLCGHVTETP